MYAFERLDRRVPGRIAVKLKLLAYRMLSDVVLIDRIHLK
jgi:hypothetical protein